MQQPMPPARTAEIIYTPEAVVQSRQGLGKGTTTLLCGGPGTGKTHSLVTLAKAGLETSVIVTDPGGEESILDALRKEKLEHLHVHTHYVAPSAASWSTLRQMFKQINDLSYAALSDIKAGIGKEGYRQLLDFLDTCEKFKCEVCGAELGPVDKWTPERALCVDSASGLNMMSLNLMIGAKPTAHMGEYGVAMNAEEQLIYKLIADTKCFIALTAHLDKTFDEVKGAMSLMPAFLGNKLAPKLPRIFSDVVLAYKEGTTFFWSTAALNIDLKNRALPLGDKLKPDFGQIISVWKVRQEQMRKAAAAQQSSLVQTTAALSATATQPQQPK